MKTVCRRPLADLVDIASGQVDPRLPPYAQMLHVGGDNIESGTGRLFGMRTPEDLNLISGKYVFDERDVLYSKIRPNLNKVATPSFSGVCSADIYPIRPRPGVMDRHFLAHLLRTNDFLAYAVKHSSRTNIPKVNRAALLAYETPVPPVSEQRRIAAILDQADTIRRKRRQAVQIVADIAPAVFCEMFPYHGVEQTATLSALGVEFRYGTSNKSEPHGSPTLRIPNVLAAALDLADLKNVPVDRAEFDRLKLRDGDLLFVRTNGNPDYVGRCAVFDSQVVAAAGYDPEHFIYASYLIRGRVDPCVLNPRYLRAFLDTPLGRQMVREQCRTSAGQYNINTHGLGSLTVPLPPIQRQEQFAQRLEEIGELEQNTVAGYADAGRLFDSLVDRAFRGEL